MTDQSFPRWVCFECRYGRAERPCADVTGSVSMEKIALHYLGLVSDGNRPEGSGQDFIWAFGCVNDMIESSAEAGWRFIRCALDQCRSLDQLRYLAAGAMEDLLSRHGAAVIECIEALARQSAKFRLLLSGCWGRHRIAPEIWKRVAAAIAQGPAIDADPRTPTAGRARRADAAEVARLLSEPLP